MLCPVCKTANLVMTERQSIEIDYCPQCRGVWLDRGELDKMIERTVPETPAAPRAAEPARMREPREEYREREREYDRDRDFKRHDDDRRHYEPRHYKKKSLLGELFDF